MAEKDDNRRQQMVKAVGEVFESYEEFRGKVALADIPADEEERPVSEGGALQVNVPEAGRKVCVKWGVDPVTGERVCLKWVDA